MLTVQYSERRTNDYLDEYPNRQRLSDDGIWVGTTLADWVCRQRAAIHSELQWRVNRAEGDFLRVRIMSDWLKQLLYWWDAEHLLFAKFETHLGDNGLTGVAWGEPLDRSRHQLEHEVKAITYHGLLVEQLGDAWLAEVIVDI